MGSNGRTKEQNAEYQRAWRAKNRDLVNAKLREKRATDPVWVAQERKTRLESYYRHRDARMATAKAKYHAEKNTSEFKQKALYARIKRRYGLSALEYEMMKARQKGKCAICGIEPKMLFVDHDHETGQVRELLCPACNGGVRKVEKLRAYIAYLEKHDELSSRGVIRLRDVQV